jgi:hypothetical protein
MVKVPTTTKSLIVVTYSCSSVSLISCVYTNNFRRELSGFDLAKCNDGSTAAYYHEQVNIRYKTKFINKLFII